MVIVFTFQKINNLENDLTKTTIESYIDSFAGFPFFEDFWKYEQVYESFEKALKKNFSSLVVPVVKDESIGGSLGYLLNNELLGDVLYIAETFIKQDMQGQKIGKKLFSNFLDTLPTSEFSTILRTKDESPAQKMYGTFGFETIDMRISNPPYENAVWMVKE